MAGKRCDACGAGLSTFATEPVRPTCHTSANLPAPAHPARRLGPPFWIWSAGETAAALASRDLSTILRTYRRINRMSQQQLADLLGYDKTSTGHPARLRLRRLRLLRGHFHRRPWQASTGMVIWPLVWFAFGSVAPDDMDAQVDRHRSKLVQTGQSQDIRHISPGRNDEADMSYPQQHAYPPPHAMPPPPAAPKSKRWPWIVGLVGAFLFGLFIGIASNPNPAKSGAAGTTVTAPAQGGAAPVQNTPPPQQPAGPATTMDSGTYQVGVDVQAGQYKTDGPKDDNPMGCYWSRLKDDSGEFVELNGSCTWTKVG